MGWLHCKQSAMLAQAGNPSTGHFPHATHAPLPFRLSVSFRSVQGSPRVRIAPRRDDVRIAAQHGSHDASAWFIHSRLAAVPHPPCRFGLLFRRVWDSVTSLLALGWHFGPLIFWLVRAMGANLRVVEVESLFGDALSASRDKAHPCGTCVATGLRAGPALRQVLLETVFGASSSSTPRRGRIHPARSTALGPLRLVAVTTRPHSL